MVHHGKDAKSFGWKFTSDERHADGRRKVGSSYAGMAQTEPMLRYYKNIWYLNTELVKYLKTDRKTNTVFLYVYDRKIEIQLPLQQWIKYRKMAFTQLELAYLLRYDYENMGRLQMRCRKAGLIPMPKAMSRNGVTAGGSWQPRLHSEDSLYIMRDQLDLIHHGRPRKDGKITSRAPTEQELKAMIGRATMLYTQNLDGEMIPVWRATE